MITRIALENWFCFESLGLNLDDAVTLFVGPNGSGKSAIRDAIVFAITGTLRSRRGVTQKNEIAQVALGDGAKAARVEILFHGGLRVVRKLTASGQTLELRDLPEGEREERTLPGSQGELQIELYRWLGVDEGRALAALDSRHFLNLGEDDRKALLFRVVGAGVTEEAIGKKLVARGLQGSDIDALARTAARAGFRKAERDAVELRRSAKRAHDDLKVARDPAPQIVQGTKGEIDLATVTVEQIEASVAKLSGDLEEIVRQGATNIASAKTTANSTRRTIGETEDELEAARAQDPEAIAARVSALEESEAALASVLSELRLQHQGARETIERGGAVTRPEMCPAIAGFTCPATQKQLAAHAKERESILAAAQATLAETSAAINANRLELDALRERIGEERGGLAEAKRLAAKVPGLEKSLSALRDQLAHAEDVAQRAEASGQAQIDTAELRQRVRRGTEIIAAKKLFDADQAARAGEAERREKAQREVDRTEQIVKAFEPDGIEQEVVKESLQPIRERLELTGAVFGERGGVEISDDLRVTTFIGGVARSEAQLSGAQLHTLGLIVQDALASLPAFPVLLFDEFSLLFQELRADVFGVLRDLVNQPYGSIFLFGATEKQVPTKPEGIGVVWCKAPGEVEVL